MAKTIYDLKLHESIEVISGPINWDVTKVEGGWIYVYIRLDCNSMTSVFVPEKTELPNVGPR